MNSLKLQKILGCKSAYRGMVVLSVLHVVLLGWSALVHSPTQDEIAHLPAGLVVWRFGDLSVYRVNPPLVRTAAAMPVLLFPHQENWEHYVPDTAIRQEWVLGRDFIKANGEATFRLFTLARWVCVPFSLAGMWVLYSWIKAKFSPGAGCFAATLWCFSPNIIGYGSLITPDIPSVTMGMLAAWRFAIWNESGRWSDAFLAGCALGLALLTKSYWIVLIAIWPVVWLLFRLIRKRDSDCSKFLKSCGSKAEEHGDDRGEFTSNAENRIARGVLLKRQALQLCCLLFVGINILNLGYGYQGTGKLLKDYNFYSAALSGELRIPNYEFPSNRFRGSLIGYVPVPLPEDFVTGIDLQKVDFETGKWSYLSGEVKDPGGWWHYYIVGLFFKVPAATSILALIGLSQLIDRQRLGSIRNYLPLIVPALAVMIIASLELQMNRHVRYVFPMLPVLYLLAVFTFQCRRKLALALLALSVASSLTSYPHCISFFNRIVGGPDLGHRHLIHSNLDWGQDLGMVKEWLEENPTSEPVYIGWDGDISPRDLGIDADLPSLRTLRPGVYIISRSDQYHPSGRFAVFRRMKPIDQVGFTFDVYRIEEEIRVWNADESTKRLRRD